ncbi:hippurate hydrolase [Arcanobacterium wilhelmae]|uniref:Hippurate hydrolase n=1 Tax=Arcanobacterium wilhelmae TaxID=1803177 RepID=A0ABT9NCA2_9ACTO|nr:amidohydrolase [Arcanobacterium wilhelmae]MDP9801334.1 hippurate hydrolase [Arcanobacterium wilhelmae]WFN90672.1 amidohydrolase [Arcanobacterium wilhelmae]
MHDVVSILEGYTSDLENIYLHLHRNPELSMQEGDTARFIGAHLEEYGFEVAKIGGGIVGILSNGSGPSVLYRADMDGLPVKEESGLPYASDIMRKNREGNSVPAMHACGHDFHMTAGLGVARFLSEHTNVWSGTYVALFQPGEETAEGAKAMVADGLVEYVLERTEQGRLDVALSQHVLTVPCAGHVGTAAGPVLSTAASVRIVLNGRGSHGSMPHLGVDPVVLASSIVMRLQGIVSREIAPSEFGVVTVGALHSGTAANVIPSSAELLLNVRAYSNETRAQIIAAIERIVKAECEASRAHDPVIEIYDEFPLTNNDPGVEATIREAFVAAFGEHRVEHLDPITASEDFSTIPDAFGSPYCYWGLGGFAEGDEVYPNHNPHFAPTLHPTLETGAAAATVAALAYLGK